MDAKKTLKSLYKIYDSEDTKEIFEQNEIQANRLSAVVMLWCAVVLLVAWLLNIFGVFSIDRSRMNGLAVQGLIELAIPLTLYFVFKGRKSWLKYVMVIALMLVCGMTALMAQKPAQIKFEKTTHNFGTFSEKNPKVSCSFSFTNVGEEPLVVNQAIASCGCTVPEYTKTPIQPGEKGEIKVTYNGEGKFPGHFKKSITVRTNGAVEMTRLYIEGDMTEGQ